MPQACKRQGAHSRKQQPWFDISCKEALVQKKAVYKNPHSTATDKDVAEKKFRSVTDRVKEACTRRGNAELCELSARDPSRFWKTFKAPHSNACPVELSAQFEAFRALMGAEPQPAPQRPADSGLSTSCSDDAYLNQDITADELSQCIKCLKRGKSPGNDGILADMIKDAGDLVQQCLLWLFNCMLASHFPEHLLQAVWVPVLQYGCQVWGMHSPRVAAANCARSDLQRLHDYYLRTDCDLLPSNPRKILLAELGLLPLQVFWWRQTLQF